MSAAEGSLGSSSPGTSAPPPASTPAVAPSAPATSTPAAPAVADVPVAGELGNATASGTGTPGAASSSEPKTLAEAYAIFDQQVADANQPDQVAAEPAPVAPVAEPAPVIPAQIQEPEAVEQPVAAAPAEAVEAAPAPAIGDEPLDDLETVLTEDLIKAKYPRQNNEFVKNVIARDAERMQLRQMRQEIGGTAGAELYRELTPILLGKEDPTIEDADAVFDLLVLDDKAGAGKLMRLMSERLINLTVQDESHGKAFADQLIADEYGIRKDNGKPYDNAAIETFVKAHKAGIISMEFLNSELDALGEAEEPSEEVLALRRQLDELKGQSVAQEAEKKAEIAKREAAYKTQAEGYVSRQVMATVMPTIIDSGWALADGEKGEQAEEKRILGDLVSTKINAHLKPTQAYKDAMQMVNEYRAFDAQGKPTPRFLQKLEPLQNMARAKFLEIRRGLAGRFKYQAQSSHNAKLAAQTGNKNGSPAPAIPPTAEPVKATTGRSASPAGKNTTELIDGFFEDYERQTAEARAQAGQGRL